MRRTRAQDRRGVLLLLILGLLAMFGIIALAFLASTSLFRRSSESAAKVEQQAHHPNKDLHGALMIALRGRDDTIMQSHGLIEDVYGADSFVAQVALDDADPADILRIRATKPNLMRLPGGDGALDTADDIPHGQLFDFTLPIRTSDPGRFVGRVITFTSGACQGESMRVVKAYQATHPTTGAPLFWLSANTTPIWKLQVAVTGRPVTGRDEQPGRKGVDDDGFNGIDDPGEFAWPAFAPSFKAAGISDDLRAGDWYVINGAAFGGMGAGYDPNTGTNGARRNLANVLIQPGGGIGNPPQNAEIALLPRAFVTRSEEQQYLGTPWWRFGPDGTPDTADDRALPGPDGNLGTADDIVMPVNLANEDYDALDFQNMLLSMPDPDPSEASITQAIPSLHRPALIQYWYAQLHAWLTGTVGLNAQDAWRAIVRPWGNDGMPNTGDEWTLTPDQARQIVMWKSRIVLRPLRELHPSFSGSNEYSTLPPDFDPMTNALRWYWDRDGGVPPLPAYAPIYSAMQGTWDVDNDGDGRADSLWMDLGFPVRSTSDGRLYKPLFSFLCVDLDGRINLNAHGSTAQLDPAFYNQAAGPFAPANAQPDAGNPMFRSLNLARGEGYGPAEINPGISGGVLSAAEYVGLLRGNVAGARDLVGRYGENASGTAEAGVTGVDDGPSQFRQTDYSDNYTNSAQLSSFASPPDLWGRTATALDYRGQPVYQRVSAAAWNNERTDDPYELRLSNYASAVSQRNWGLYDNPYGVAEMERYLRLFDADNYRLPGRLAELAPSLVNPAMPNRNLVTTDSWTIPGLQAAMSRELESAFNARIDAHLNTIKSTPPAPPDGQQLLDWLRLFRARSQYLRGLPDLLAVRVYLEMTAAGNTVNEIRIRQRLIDQLLASAAQSQPGLPPLLANRWAISQFLPYESLLGLKLDLNRPLGNGRDDDGDGIVDEVGEAELGWTGVYGTPVGFQLANGVDVNGDGVHDLTDQGLARQLMARHLFVLMMLLRDDGYDLPRTDYGGVTTQDQADFPAGSAGSRELTVRRIAQWAVNVVDFRDFDSAMTPFEYDINPFNGWSVDGNVSTPDLLPGGAPNPERRIVWGCERPELLISETFACHDRRVADTAFDDGDNKKRDDNGDGTPDEDEDLDQTRIPQGSAFFELYCTGNSNTAAMPSDLYSYNGSQWYLDLNRLAPAGPAGLQYPVWRMAITENTREQTDTVPTPAGPADAEDIRTRVYQYPDSISLEPPQYRQGLPTDPSPLSTDNFSLVDPLIATLLPAPQLERIVWFTNQAPAEPTAVPPPPGDTYHRDYDRIFYRQAGTSGVTPGSYVVVGPRARTNLGSATTALGDPSPNEIRLDNVRVIDADGTDNYPIYAPAAGQQAHIKQPFGMICASRPPHAPLVPSASEWTHTANTAPTGIGLSISEPLASGDGVTEARYYPEPDEPGRIGGLIDAYGDLDMTDTTKPFRDEPLEKQTDALHPLGMDRNGGTNLLETRTNTNYKTVFLQRLADPSQPYDPVTNPYRTVDWSPIDLTVFNGEDHRPSGWTGPAWDPEDPGWDPTNPPSGLIKFATRERKPENAGTMNIWDQFHNDDPPDTARDPALALHFQYNLQQTLGFLNTAFHDPTAQPTYLRPWLTEQDPTIMPGSPTYRPVPPVYYGDPFRPFPHLAWNNRPYVSATELLLVPSSHPARILHEYSMQLALGNPYSAETATTLGFGHTFAYLPNFFHTPTDPTATRSPHLYRLLEYVGVPSRFVDTETYLNPAFAANDPGARLMRPPFSKLSHYREPGRVNLNTIADPRVWTSIFNGHPGPTWADFVQSRRSYGASGLPIDLLDPAYPTQFANPFRGASSAGLVPPLLTGATLGVARPTNATLLRAKGDDPDTNANPLLEFTSALPHNDTSRNPTFRYQQLERLENLVTTQSNVYAMWITVGYFEVSPIAYQPADQNHVTYRMSADEFVAIYGSGYALGAELGSDTGEIERHRAFYIIDRSVPVGFLRGHDLNVENTVRLQRYIE